MKEFVKDYFELTKESVKFMKKHWKGMTVTYLITFGVSYGYFYAKDKKLERELAKEMSLYNDLSKEET